MSDIEVIVWLAVVAVLVGYLCYRHEQRIRFRLEPRDSAKWTGKAIDLTILSPRVERLRGDYLAARPPARGVCFHRALIRLARQAVAQLAYFHDRAA